ncbi:MAG: ComEC/Rec2 family competence protein, partial [Pirellulaceae bacterium]
LDQRGIPVDRVASGDQLSVCSSVSFDVLNPPISVNEDDSDNSDSIVLNVQYDKRNLLLTGDVEGPGLDRLLSMPARTHDLVLAPHHGSKNSRPTEFLHWAQPRYVVVSSHRRKNRDLYELLPAADRPHVFHTGLDGAVLAVISRDQVSVRSWYASPW